MNYQEKNTEQSEKLRKENKGRKEEDGRKGRKLAAAGYLTLAFLCAAGAMPSYAGPSADASLGIQGAGPAGAVQSPGGAFGAAVDSSYYNQKISNPIVKPVDGYSYEQMVSDLFALAARYPGTMTLQAVGQSLDGRAIYEAIVGNPSASKKILIQGTIHGREYIVAPLLMQQMESLLAGYSQGSYQGQPLSMLLQQVAIHFVPMANPDGVAISQKGEAGVQSPELRQILQAAYQRDKAEGRTVLEYGEYLKRWKSNARGVDLNYNFNAEWEALSPGLTHASYIGYPGFAPESEPEAQTLANLTRRTSFAATISYHAMGNVIYWDTEGNQAAEQSYELALTAASATGYTVMGSKGKGGFKDWLQRLNPAVPGITIEVGRSECPVSFSEYSAIWAENKAIPALLADYVRSH